MELKSQMELKQMWKIIGIVYDFGLVSGPMLCWSWSVGQDAANVV